MNQPALCAVTGLYRRARNTSGHRRGFYIQSQAVGLQRRSMATVTSRLEEWCYVALVINRDVLDLRRRSRGRGD